MSINTYLICWLAIVVGFVASQTATDSCVDGTKIASEVNCKNYSECQAGSYVNKTCGFWQEFDVKYNKCRWSPLATCYTSKKMNKASVVETLSLKENTNNLYCNYTSEKCTHGVPVIDNCNWYCRCYQDGNYSTPIQCKEGTYYNINLYACDDGNKDACKNTPTDPTVGARCLTSKDTMKVTGQCKQYYECSSENTWTVQQCSWGQYYDASSFKCAYNWFFVHCKN